MKIPKIFMPDKNLDEKIEELNQPYEEKPKTIDIEDLMDNWVKIIYEGVDCTKLTYPEIAKKEREVEMRMFEKIIQDTLSGTIKWEKWSKEKYHSRVCITNAAGKEIIIPVIFYTPSGTKNTYSLIYLGDERGPCINTCDKHMKRLALNYFKKDHNKNENTQDIHT